MVVWIIGFADIQFPFICFISHVCFTVLEQNVLYFFLAVVSIHFVSIINHYKRNHSYFRGYINLLLTAQQYKLYLIIVLKLCFHCNFLNFDYWMIQSEPLNETKMIRHSISLQNSIRSNEFVKIF